MTHRIHRQFYVIAYCGLVCILQLNGSLSDPYSMNGVRSPASLSSKKLHQHTDGHMGGVATEFSRTPGKKLDGNRNGKNAVVSLEDDFVSDFDICHIILQKFLYCVWL